MSRRASPTLIGLFTIVALTLFVGAVLALGGAQWFHKSKRYVAYFQESVKGLRIGAPVDFRGVRIGQVIEIRLVYQREDGSFFVPVLLEIDPDTVSMVGEPLSDAEMQHLVSEGLRAQLQMESLVTGQLYVSLDTFDQKNVVALSVGPARQDGMLQIPTVPSPWAELKRPLETVVTEFPHLLEEAGRTITEANRILSSIDLQRLGRAIDGAAVLATALADPEGPLQLALAEVAPLAQDLRTTVAGLPPLIQDLRSAAASVRRLADTGDAAVTDLKPGLAESLAELERVLLAARRASEQLGGLAGEVRPGLRDLSNRGIPTFMGLVDDTDRMVNNLNGAIRDMRQDPARFFFGSPTSQGVRPR